MTTNINEMTIGQLNDFLTDKISDMVDEAHEDLLKLANVVTSATSCETSDVGGVGEVSGSIGDLLDNTTEYDNVAEEMSSTLGVIIKRGEKLVQKLEQRGKGELTEANILKADVVKAKQKRQLWKSHADWAKQKSRKWKQEKKNARSYSNELRKKLEQYKRNESELKHKWQKAQDFWKEGKSFVQKLKEINREDTDKLNELRKEWIKFLKNAEKLLKKAQILSQKLKGVWKKDEFYIQKVRNWVNSKKREMQQEEAENQSRKIIETEELERIWIKKLEDDEQNAQNKLKEP